MSVRYNQTEYAYISAKVRALENSLVTRAQLGRMLSAQNTEEAFAVLRDNGFTVSGSVSAAACEDVLLGALKNGFDSMKRGLPEPRFLNVFRYPYDCSNIKSAIKCEMRGLNPDSMMFDIGSVPVDVLLRSVRERDFSALPENMAKAAPEAIEAFNRTKNPQKIDFILDRACYLDINAVDKKLKIRYITRLCRSKADLTNFMICLRVLRMECGAYGEKLIEEALVDGGSVPKQDFAAAFAGGEEKLFGLIGKTYAFVTGRCKSGDDLEKIERVCDDYRLSVAREGKHTTFGIEIPSAYIIALENEIQNIRIILAGKDAGLETPKIEERLRDCYV